MTLYEKINHLPLDAQLIALRKVRAEIYKSSLYRLAKYGCKYKDVNLRTHQSVFQALENNSKRKLIVMPRGTFKSSICSVAFPIWLLIRDFNTRILLDSELYTNSKNLLREIRSHLLSEWFSELYGDAKSDTWNESEVLIKQRTEVRKEATITASGIGAEKTGQHYDFIIMDDLNSPSNSNTKEGREKVIQHYQYNTSILEPTGTMVIVGTRYSESDVIGYVMANEIKDNVDGLL